MEDPSSKSNLVAGDEKTQTEVPSLPSKATIDEPEEPHKPVLPEVYTATWLHDDHISELTRILHGVEAGSVSNCLIEYVEENIEPVGWKAIWKRKRADHFSPSTTMVQDTDRTASPCSEEVSESKQWFVVEVMNVSRDRLEAEVKYCEVTRKEMTKDKLHEEFMVPLAELYPLAAQENGALDIATTAEVVEQIRFFYDHIWQAWDLEEESCYYDHHLISSRLKLYHDIESRRIPSSMGVELRRLVKTANAVQKEIERTESLTDDDDLDQEKVSILIQLHKSLANLKTRFDVLQEPVLRELSSAQSLDLCWPGSYQRSDEANILVVINRVSMEMLETFSKLPSILKTLPEIPLDARCQGLPSLQFALDASRKGDVIVALPGVHSLQHMGLLSGGGTLIGFGDNVVIESSSEAGDVSIDSSGDLTLLNITLKPLPNQIGIVHHSGALVLKKVKIDGASTGVICLGKTYSRIEECSFQDCQDKGLDLREGACVDLLGSSISECDVAVQLQDGSKVSISNCSIKDSAACGVLVTRPDGSNQSPFKDLPKEDLMKRLLKDFEGNSFSGNGEDVAVRLTGEEVHSNMMGKESSH